MSNSQEYNGWQNFATWKIQLELFDGLDPNDLFPDEFLGAGGLADCLRSYAQDYVDENSGFLVQGWARAFLSEVNFYQIAKHMVEAYPQENEAAE